MPATQQILEELKAKSKLPSLPKVINKLLSLISNPMASLEDISNIISLDPATGGRILRLANSVSFGFSEKTASIDEAIGRIGFQSTCDIVVSMALINTFDKVDGVELNQFWLHSLSVAFAAQLIEKRSPKINGLSDEAYTAGLFHDLGILVLANYFGEKYSEVIQTAYDDEQPLRIVEKEMLGIGHPEAGHALLSHWEIPEIISKAAWDHQRPAAPHEGSTPGEIMAQVIHMANFACNHQGIHNGIDTCGFSFSEATWFDMGLSVESIPEMIEEVLMKVEATHNILNAATV
tara:strand:+ start:14925 stop:15797 length:873 start_codon:yes stop_codon:yes gene_type:complete